MLWLGIDGALGPFSTALVAADGSRPPRTAVTAGKDALERGLTSIDEVLGETPLRALAGIAVGTGPGAFTGLRIALSYAKSLALATGVPLAGISSFDALEPADAALPSATFVEGRAGIVCVRVRGSGAELRVCGTYEDVAQALAARLAAGSTLVAYGAAEGVTPALGERGITVRSLATKPEIPALAVVRRALQSAPAGSPHAVQADYGEAHYAARSEFRTTP